MEKKCSLSGMKNKSVKKLREGAVVSKDRTQNTLFISSPTCIGYRVDINAALETIIETEASDRVLRAHKSP